MASAPRMAGKRLAQELAELNKNPPEGVSAGPISDDDLFKWEATIMGPEDTVYEGGCFSAVLEFPPDYPMSPPSMKFTTPLFHPNIYPDGRVCISILHAPGEDEYGYEDSSERWSPVQSIEKILLSVVSMLAAPNLESPANVDAGKLLRDDPKAFRRRVKQDVRASLGE